MIFFIPTPTAGPDFGPFDFSFNLRNRYEQRRDAVFDGSTEDDRFNLFTRGRIQLDYSSSETAKFRVVYQYTNNQIMPVGGSDSSVTGQDLVEAYLEDSSGGSLFRIGRQKVNKGNQRLLGALEWVDSSRSWLGVRAKNGSWDLFWGRLAINPAPNFNAQVGLAAYKSSFGETSLIYKHDTKPADTVSVTTLDHTWSKSAGRVALSAEGALQWGRSGGKDLEAWAATAKVKFSVSDDVELFVEANVASGGSSATKTRTFDNLYPTNHLYYGYVDRQGWSNMKSLVLGASWKAQKNLSLHATWHSFKLFDDKDGWYNVAGKVNTGPGGAYIDPTGASGDDIGSEFDFVVKWNPAAGHSVAAGFSMFNAGSFVKSFLGGSAATNTWGFVQYGLKF